MPTTTTDTTEPTMSPKVAAMFENPAVQAVLVTMGHAYGKARFGGACRLTGLPIRVGHAIRELAFWTRTGRYFSGYVPVRTAEVVAFRGCDPGVSAWQFSRTPDVDLAALPVGSSVSTMKLEAGAEDVTITTWSLGALGDRRQWTRIGTYNRSTDAQLQAAFKRSTNLIAFKVETPIVYL